MFGCVKLEENRLWQNPRRFGRDACNKPQTMLRENEIGEDLGTYISGSAADDDVKLQWSNITALSTDLWPSWWWNWAEGGYLEKKHASKKSKDRDLFSFSSVFGTRSSSSSSGNESLNSETDQHFKRENRAPKIKLGEARRKERSNTQAAMLVSETFHKKHFGFYSRFRTWIPATRYDRDKKLNDQTTRSDTFLEITKLKVL